MRPLELLFVLALALYTGVIWTHRFRRRLAKWMIIVFGLALIADLTATILVCAGAPGGWTWSLHTTTGLVSLVIMTVHFAWGVSAVAAQGEYEAYFTRYSLYAWSLWVVSFISGIPR
jgi:uncharacterized repeat protein (TIGR03987 family)